MTLQGTHLHNDRIYSNVFLFWSCFIRRGRWIILWSALTNFIHPSGVRSATGLLARLTSVSCTAQLVAPRCTETLWPAIICAISSKDTYFTRSALTTCNPTTRTETTFGKSRTTLILPSLCRCLWPRMWNQALIGWNLQRRRVDQVGARERQPSFSSIS